MRSKALWFVAVALLIGVVVVFTRKGEGDAPAAEGFPTVEADAEPDASPQLATFGNGCFWCTEAVFQQLTGVEKVVSGYSGGSVANPTYRQVCTGTTSHAEVIQVTYDPKVITYPELLEVFWRTHDPTTLNRQGHDVGTQYRSAIFYHTPRQKDLAETYKQRIDAAHVFSSPVVTEVVAFTAFYPAEANHQNYYATHQQQGYCRTVIRPKLDKLQKVFPQKLKPKE